MNDDRFDGFPVDDDFSVLPPEVESALLVNSVSSASRGSFTGSRSSGGKPVMGKVFERKPVGQKPGAFKLEAQKLETQKPVSASDAVAVPTLGSEAVRLLEEKLAFVVSAAVGPFAEKGSPYALELRNVARSALVLLIESVPPDEFVRLGQALAFRRLLGVLESERLGAVRRGWVWPRVVRRGASWLLSGFSSFSSSKVRLLLGLALVCFAVASATWLVSVSVSGLDARVSPGSRSSR